MSNVIPPGSSIGIVGGGQLGRMFTVAAKRMGHHVRVFTPQPNSPAGQVADLELCASFSDVDAVRRFARDVDVITYEFENIPYGMLRLMDQWAPVRPRPEVLLTTQHRLREKTFLQRVDVPTAPFQSICSLADVDQVDAELLPGVLKTATSGYDGKGQRTVADRKGLQAAWSALHTEEAVLEKWIDFECELSVVVARGLGGEVACMGPILNYHRNHILDVSVCPAGLPTGVAQDAERIAQHIVRHLDVVGVLCIEFFLDREGQLLVNEMAPRPHNSGHLTIDSHVTDQFEQQVRSVCGWSLGSTQQLRPAAMANLLGECWRQGEPNWTHLLGNPDLKVHLYGKTGPKLGRKMGHMTVLAETGEAAMQSVVNARQRLLAGQNASNEA